MTSVQQAPSAAPVRPRVLLPRRWITVGLFVCAILLLVGSVLVKSIELAFGNDHIFGLKRLLWVDEEANLPTWFSSALLLISAVLLIAIGVLTRHTRGTERWRWLTLGLVFLLLAIDEVAGVHEISARHAARTGGIGAFSGDAASFAWVLFALPVVMLAAAAFWPFVRGLASPVRNRMAAGAATFFLSALGVEAITGLLVGLNPHTWTYLALATVEEGGEMIGALLFVDALLLHVRSEVGPIELRVT